MGRNKYPEQTLENILTVSARLFTEKGYEQTSIQDILDVLNLSKGGLYHHFKSKEEILEAVMQRRSCYISDMLHRIIQDTPAKNAREKLKKILHYIGSDTETHALDIVMSSQIKNPHFVVSGMQNCIKLDAPVIARLISDGIADGSMQTPEPDLCAEVFLLLLNFWVNPVLFSRSQAETEKRLRYLGTMLDQLGLDLLDEELISVLMRAYESMRGFQAERSGKDETK